VIFMERPLNETVGKAFSAGGSMWSEPPLSAGLKASPAVQAEAG